MMWGLTNVDRYRLVVLQGLAAGELECAIKPLTSGLLPSDVTILVVDKEVKRTPELSIFCVMKM